MADERVRIEVGFQGGQVIGAFVDPASAEELERAAVGLLRPLDEPANVLGRLA